MKVEKKTSNTAGWIKIPEANLRAIEAENADLRTQLEEMMKKADAVGDAQFVIGVLTKNINVRNAEYAALKSRVTLLERIIDRVTAWAKCQQYDRVKKLFEILAKKPT